MLTGGVSSTAEGGLDVPHAEARQSIDAQAACGKIQPIFDRETITWQMTDHFGINHPALGPAQIGYAPQVE